MKCLEWVGDLSEGVGFCPRSLRVKSCSGEQNEMAAYIDTVKKAYVDVNRRTTECKHRILTAVPPHMA